jgi:hypothetical protein
MRSRLVRPETTKLPLSDNDWVLIKKRLNAGEHRAHLSRMFQNAREMRDGTLRLDPRDVGLSKAVAYIIDWSLVDDDGEVISVRDKGEDVLIAALDAIEPETFDEITDAIDAHANAMAQERAASKKIRDGETQLPETSPSPVDSGGASNGSVN